MLTIYVDNGIIMAYLAAKLDGTFSGKFSEWREAADEAAEIYAADPWPDPSAFEPPAET